MGNSEARKELERIFGKICFIEKLGIRYIPPKERKRIKGYTKYDDMLTYHHIVEKQNGGKSTIENGAIVRGYNHRWLHSLSEQEKQLINEAMQTYKASVLRAVNKGIEIKPEDIISQEDLYDVLKMTSLAFNSKEIDKKKRKEKFNRAKEKKKTQQLINDALYGDDYDR